MQTFERLRLSMRPLKKHGLGSRSMELSTDILTGLRGRLCCPSTLLISPHLGLFMIFNPSEKLKKNGLSISLTESAVFLPTDGPSGRPHRNAELRSSLVRGLLVLELAKPTKITSIELELVAKASTAWPEGEKFSDSFLENSNSQGRQNQVSGLVVLRWQNSIEPIVPQPSISRPIR